MPFYAGRFQSANYEGICDRYVGQTSVCHQKEAIMKTIRLFVAIAFTFFMSTPFSFSAEDYSAAMRAKPSPGNLISMDFQDANLKTVLKIFSQQSGLNFVASQNVQDRTVTIYFDNVTVEDALNHIMNANNLAYEQKPGSNIFIVKESGRPAIETITKIYELKYAQLSSPPSGEDGEGEDTEEEAQILSVLKGVMSENGRIVANSRSNSLIITDVPSQFVIIEEVLSRLDVRTPQVMIEAEILETTTTVADKLGLDWTGAFGVYAGPVHNTIWPLRGGLGKDNSSGEGISATGSVNLSGMGVTLRAILGNSDTKILARPKVLTLNNEPAIIELTARTAVASITSSSGVGGAESTTTSAERLNTGITLEVTPQINKDGYITMHIEPTVIIPVLSKFFTGTGTNQQKFVDPQTRSTNTTVMVRDGETIIIGGLISKEDTHSYEKIPFLGDLPLLGSAFRYKATDKDDKELLIFITPHIVKETVYAFGDTSEREQEKPKAVKEEEVESLLDLLGG